MKSSVATRLTAFVICLLALCPANIQSQFVPGEGGVITFTNFSPDAGKFGGLLVGKSDRYYDSFFGGTRASIDIGFPKAETLGAESLTLQYQKPDGIWENMKNGEVALTTTGDNFSLNLSTPHTLRLIANGGLKNGFTSNVVVATPSAISTRFSSWGLDESMWISGIMVPWVGRGLQARFSVKKTPEETEVTGGLSYQWYRVNPLTYAMTQISGATELTYITTNADVGYIMLIKAAGDGQTVGGYINYTSSWPIVHPNKAYASDISLNGFRLNLFKHIDAIPVSELELRDKNYEIVPVSSVTKVGNGAMYDIAVSLSKEKSPYTLSNHSPFWKIAQVIEHPGHEMMMEFISIDVSTVGLIVPESNTRIFPVPAKEVLNFSADETIIKAEILNLQGKMITFAYQFSNAGMIDISQLEQGSYLIRLTGNSYTIVKSFTKI